MELISEETDGLACFEYAGQRREKLGLHGAGNAILPCPVLSCPVLYCTARAISIFVVEKVCFCGWHIRALHCC